MYTTDAVAGYSDTIMVTISTMAPPNLGPDVTLYKDCYCETTNLTSLFGTTGFSSTWNTPSPSSVHPGTYRLVAANAANCTDTAFADVLLEVATRTGAISSNWNIAGNWNINKVPIAQTHIIVRGSTPNPCIISTANAAVASIQVGNGGTVRSINNKQIDVDGKCLTLPPN